MDERWPSWPPWSLLSENTTQLASMGAEQQRVPLGKRQGPQGAPFLEGTGLGGDPRTRLGFPWSVN